MKEQDEMIKLGRIISLKTSDILLEEEWKKNFPGIGKVFGDFFGNKSRNIRERQETVKSELVDVAADYLGVKRDRALKVVRHINLGVRDDEDIASSEGVPVQGVSCFI